MKKSLLAATLLSLTLPAASHAANVPKKATAQTTLGLYTTAREAWQMLQGDRNAILVDVRDPIEIKFTGFATETDIHVPWMLSAPEKWVEKRQSWGMKKNPDFAQQLQEKLDDLKAGKNSTIIIMCRSGSTRSAPAVNLLAEKGYTNVWTVVDGFEGGKLKQGESKGVRARNGWRNSGLPWSYKVNPAVAWRPASDR
ncbi:MAG: rhodanese-like domain-containing protein [Marinobacterium sp.]|nr:rhodanese-like domain-containing protein [Marinobacterium sp.]